MKGFRVQLSFMKVAPYLQRADLDVPDRLGEIIDADDSWLIVRDDRSAPAWVIVAREITGC